MNINLFYFIGWLSYFCSSEVQAPSQTSNPSSDLLPKSFPFDVPVCRLNSLSQRHNEASLFLKDAMSVSSGLLSSITSLCDLGPVLLERNKQIWFAGTWFVWVWAHLLIMDSSQTNPIPFPAPPQVLRAPGDYRKLPWMFAPFVIDSQKWVQDCVSKHWLAHWLICLSHAMTLKYKRIPLL